MILSILLMALREIRRHVLRSALTTLGIVIGVAAVVTLVTLGRGATANVTADVARMGNDLLMVFPGAERRGPASSAATPFTVADVRAIEREVASVRAIAPTASSGALAVYGSANRNVTVTGSWASYLDVRGYELAEGRVFNPSEESSSAPVCVLGATVRNELFGAQPAVDESIRVGKVSCRVIGVLASKGAATFGADQDDFVLMPLRTVQRRLVGNDAVSAIFVSAANERAIARTKTQIEGLMKERRRVPPGQPQDFNVRDMKEIGDTLKAITGTLTALLGAIAAVSLLVGGIGIMNIMLVSVTERTREIGIRMAIGASAREVLLQFLLEAVVLCLLGGAAGITLGLLGSAIAAALLDMPFIIAPEIIAVAFLFSAAVGIAFGYFPARKAAHLNPIEALRHE